MLKTLQVIHQQSCSDHLGVLTLHSKSPVLIPAGYQVVLEGFAKVSVPSDQHAVIQHPDSGLPDGLCVSSCFVTLPTRFPHLIPVIVRNESEQDTLLPPLTIIADLRTYQCIISEQCVTNAPVSENEANSLNFNFGESPLSPEWKERITAKLKSMSDVFSHP